MTIFNTAFSQITADIVQTSGVLDAPAVESVSVGTSPGPYREIRIRIGLGVPITRRYELTVVFRDEAFEGFDLLGKAKTRDNKPEAG